MVVISSTNRQATAWLCSAGRAHRFVFFVLPSAAVYSTSCREGELGKDVKNILTMGSQERFPHIVREQPGHGLLLRNGFLCALDPFNLTDFAWPRECADQMFNLLPHAHPTQISCKKLPPDTHHRCLYPSAPEPCQVQNSWTDLRHQTIWQAGI